MATESKKRAKERRPPGLSEDAGEGNEAGVLRGTS